MNDNIVHMLFYWDENNQYVFSRTKFLAVISFIVAFLCSLPAPLFIIPFLMGFIGSVPVFIIGFLIHNFRNNDSSFYNDNLWDNIKHFLFYWYDSANKFTLSKTKLITVFMVIIGLLWALETAIMSGESGSNLAGSMIAYILICLFLATILFLIGFVFHRFFESKKDSAKPISNNSRINDVKKVKPIKKNVDNSNTNPDLIKINELKKEFDEKEVTTKELIKAKFQPPQITYDRFISVVDNCSNIFNEQYSITLNLINFSKEDSKRVDEEINSKINTLQSLIDKLNDLSDELVINMSKTKNDDINNVLNDMENLISSINNYED